ncbi:hypothetical protein L2E82_17492 [Cichorium intybus]|uniref:Uncharacterized protein n=1 Tax=Cichorium intybus TaxID=13427 RepID=A0ACB9F7R3_CICIN|nr:hypothetical protein L2E82_17492 [Cichorium intybus]
MTVQEAVSELKYLGRIKILNLVPLMGYCLASEQLITIYDYMENGSLHICFTIFVLDSGTTSPETVDNGGISLEDIGFARNELEFSLEKTKVF